jgi:2-amino-4-hydroxy-6-hydroxymethyldihydropteridine diphosphokinase
MNRQEHDPHHNHPSIRVILGLGGNLGDPPHAFEAALEALAECHAVTALSGLYRSEPVGPPQPRYWNMAALLEASSSLLELLDLCQELEAAAGRDRSQEVTWGPRPLDLDLLLADGIVCRGPRLVLPHPHFLKRSFALVPAAEVAPDWIVPGTDRSLQQLAEGMACELEAVERPW